MRFGSRIRALLIVLTMVVMASPMVSAQTTMDATPESQAPIETPAGDVPPADDGGIPDETTPPDEGGGSVEGPVVSEPAPPDEDDGTPDADAPADESTQVPVDENVPTDEPVAGEDAITPESTPQMQSRTAGDFEVMATRTLEITVVTSDGEPVPVDTEVCIWNSNEGCQFWNGETLTYSVYSLTTEYRVYAPSGSGYAGFEGTISVPTGQTTVETLTLLKKATAEITVVAAGGADVPDGTEVCIWNSDEGCQDWTGSELIFTVDPGTVEYEVRVADDSGFADAFGTFSVATGATTSQIITLEAPGMLNVTVVTADGGPLPDWADVSVFPSEEGWDYYEGVPLTFTVTPGEVEWDIYLDWDARYHETSGTVAVGAGETVNLTIELQPLDPGTLRVYVTTDDGMPVPDGTEVCVNMPVPEFGDPVENLCQTATGSFVTFTLDRGDAEITVTPPEGSGYLGATDTYWVELAETTRVVFELTSDESAFDATVAITIRMEDGTPVDTSSVGACLYVGSTLNILVIDSCNSWYSDLTENPDGSVTLSFNVRAGTYSYLAGASNFRLFEGTVTAVADETAEVEIVIPSEDQESATVTINVVTLNGEAVPEDTEVCVGSFVFDEEEDESCRPWTGTALTFNVVPGPVIYGAMAPQDSGYVPTIMILPNLIRSGEAINVEVTLYPIEFDTSITMSVSDEAPHSGDEVTYTIRAVGNVGNMLGATRSYEAETHFEITDTLPAELTDVSVTCSGTYMPSIPGTCFDLQGQELTVFGEYWLTGMFDVTVTVTGTITGDPGTVVTNTAYVNNQMWGNEDRLSLDESLIASTDLSGLAFQVVGDLPSASATLVIAGQVPVDPTPTPVDPTPVPTETPDPVDPTPEPGVTPTPSPTVEPGTTPSPAPADSSAPSDPATPAADGAVTSLPKTGSGGTLAASGALYGALMATALLLAGGLVIRVRGTRDEA